MSAFNIKLKQSLLRKGQGFIYLAKKNGQHVFMHGDRDDIKLDSIDAESVIAIKYVGSESLYIGFKNNFATLFSKTVKQVFTLGDVTVLFDEETGYIKYSQGAPLLAKKKILIVDDSKTIQKLLSNIISSSQQMEVVGVASCPSEAKKFLENNEVDLITLDIHMPEMNGVEFLKTYLKFLNKKVVMISAVTPSEGPLVMDALSNGAVTYIQKPDIDNLHELQKDIIEKIECIFTSTSTLDVKKSIFSGDFKHQDGLIAIGSSTGGTQALEAILTALPAKIPPIVIVQHIPPIFSKALADRLSTLCRFNVCEATHGMEILANNVYIAPGGMQMKVSGNKSRMSLVVNEDPPVNRFRPSVDYLFDSISQVKGLNCVAVILTGMGKDGAQGLLKLKNSGAKTIAQDEKSCVVFGMPKEAIKLGAADVVLPLSSIARELALKF